MPLYHETSVKLKEPCLLKVQLCQGIFYYQRFRTSYATEKKVTVKVTQKVTVNQKKIIEAIKKNPFITQEELSQIIGLTRKSIVQNMKKLQENGLLKRVGADKNCHWEIQDGKRSKTI